MVISFADPVWGGSKQNPLLTLFAGFVFSVFFRKQVFGEAGKHKTPPFQVGFCFAESKGFEPLVRETRTTVFETAPFDHSGNSPRQK